MKRKYKGNRIVLGLREDKTPIIWDDAVRNQAPHAAIFGGSGSGKTRALAAIAIQHIEQWSTTHQGTLFIEENGEITDLVKIMFRGLFRHPFERIKKVEPFSLFVCHLRQQDRSAALVNSALEKVSWNEARVRRIDFK